MKLRAVTLENLRRFGGMRARLSGIGDGLSVISEANEFGKSTFFDAIHAVFFERYSSSAKAVKSLQPHAGGAVAIAAEIELDGKEYRIEKRYLAQKGASITELPSGRVIARDGEAEAWIAARLGEAGQGPAGFLWVRQGVTGLEPADASKIERDKLSELRRDLMSSLAGEIDQITGGRRMDRILSRIKEDLTRIATPTGRPAGPWKEALAQAEEMGAKLERLNASCAELSEALARKRQLEESLARLSDPAFLARLQADLTDSKDRLEQASAYQAKREAALQAREIAQLHAQNAAEALDTLRANCAAADLAATELTRRDAEHQTAAEAHRKAQARVDAARETLTKAETRVQELHDERRRAERAVDAARARAQIEQATLRRDQAREHQRALEQAEALLAQNPATRENLDAAEEAEALLSQLRAALNARATVLRVEYDGAARFTLGDGDIPPGTDIPLTGAAVINAPGIGTLHLTPPARDEAADLPAQIERAAQDTRDALRACGAETLAQARANARSRAEASDAQRSAQGLLKIVAPDGVEALDTALEALRAAAAPPDELPSRPLAEIETDLTEADQRRLEAQQAREVAQAQAEDARDHATRAESALTTATEALGRANEAAGPAEDRANRLHNAQTHATTTQAELTAAQAELDRLGPPEMDLETARANQTRAAKALEQNREKSNRMEVDIAGLTARIAARAEQDVETRRDEMVEKLAVIQARVARFNAERDALQRLQAELQAARGKARDAYFGPVQAEMAPLLAILHSDAKLEWESDSVLPAALNRAGMTEDFQILSGGTQEQLAILTRLAFARLFAKRGQHLPIILDDALVYSDDDRIVKMFTALNRVADDQQIIVFSCRQMAFATLGGDSPPIEITALDG